MSWAYEAQHCSGAQSWQPTNSTGSVPNTKLSERGKGRTPNLSVLFSLTRWSVSGRVRFLERNHQLASRDHFKSCFLSDNILTHDEIRGELQSYSESRQLGLRQSVGSPQQLWPPCTEMRGNCDPGLTFPQSIAQLSQEGDHNSLIMGLWSVWPRARKHWKCPLESICFRLLPVYRKPHMLTWAFLLPSECRGFRRLIAKLLFWLRFEWQAYWVWVVWFGFFPLLCCILTLHISPLQRS